VSFFFFSLLLHVYKWIRTFSSFFPLFFFLWLFLFVLLLLLFLLLLCTVFFLFFFLFIIFLFCVLRVAWAPLLLDCQEDNIVDVCHGRLDRLNPSHITSSSISVLNAHLCSALHKMLSSCSKCAVKYIYCRKEEERTERSPHTITMQPYWSAVSYKQSLSSTPKRFILSPIECWWDEEIYLL
jgi:hypothetical protein